MSSYDNVKDGDMPCEREMMKLEQLTPPERAIFEWQYRLAGGFKTALMEAIAKADERNLAQLRLGFPSEVEGFLAFSRISGWWKDVQQRMGAPS